MWDSDNGQGSDDDISDQFRIPNMDAEADFELSKLQTVEGDYGIGNFTLTYYNLTNDPDACDSSSTPADMYCSSSPSPQGRSCQWQHILC